MSYSQQSHKPSRSKRPARPSRPNTSTKSSRPQLTKPQPIQQYTQPPPKTTTQIIPHAKQLKYIQRDAISISWCPISSSLPSTNTNTSHLLACAYEEMDKNFNSISSLEILNTCPSIPGHSMNSLGFIQSKMRFSTICWGHTPPSNTSTEHGLIAGGMENGLLSIWNPKKMIKHMRNEKYQESCLIVEQHKHKERITAMQFNPNRSQMFLATASLDQQLYVWDLMNPSKPKGQRPPESESASSHSYPKHITCLQWNYNVPHILATANVIGQMDIYDLRQRKKFLTIGSRTPVAATAVQWKPHKIRHLLVCYANNQAELWDLRQNRSPKLYLQGGHTRPILDATWSTIDPTLLLTSGEDKIGTIWNGNTGEILHQIQFDCPNLSADWSPTHGGSLACVSSQNGRVLVYDCTDVGLKYCPNWMKRSSGVNIGFGGRIVSFGKHYERREDITPRNSTTNGKTKEVLLYPSINISTVPQSQTMINRAINFKKVLENLNDSSQLIKYANIKVDTLQSMADDGAVVGSADGQKLSPEKKKEIEFEKCVWEWIRLFYNENCKESIIEYLGFKREELVENRAGVQQNGFSASDISSPKTCTISEENIHIEENVELISEQPLSLPAINAMISVSSSDDDDFFNQASNDTNVAHVSDVDDITDIITGEVDDKSTEVKIDDEKSGVTFDERESKNEVKKRLYERPSSVDIQIREAFIVKDYKKVVEQSIEAGNMADALVFGYYGGEELFQYARDVYFKQHSQKFICNTVKYVVKGEFEELVHTSDLRKWKETLAILLTFTSNTQLIDLCNELGLRLFEEKCNFEGSIACYLCSNNISQLISLWTLNKKQHKKPIDFILNECITKALLYINAPFTIEQNIDKTANAALSNIFCRYANLLANQGSLSEAAMFLTFVSSLKTLNTNDPQIQQLLERISICDPQIMHEQKQMYTQQMQGNGNSTAPVKRRQTSGGSSSGSGSAKGRPSRPSRPQKVIRERHVSNVKQHVQQQHVQQRNEQQQHVQPQHVQNSRRSNMPVRNRGVRTLPNSRVQTPRKPVQNVQKVQNVHRLPSRNILQNPGTREINDGITKMASMSKTPSLPQRTRRKPTAMSAKNTPMKQHVQQHVQQNIKRKPVRRNINEQYVNRLESNGEQHVQHVQNNESANKYSVAKTSTGSGFFGQTSLRTNANANEPLPADALDICQNIEQYLFDISENSNLMQNFSNSERKNISQCYENKIEPYLVQAITNSELSYYAYSTLLDMFDALYGKQYEMAVKKFQEIVKNNKEFKRNRQWLMAFKQIITIAKKYKI